MSQEPRTHFTSLTEPEKKSKLWQLSSAKGKCTLWQRGQKERRPFRVKDFIREESRLVLHRETAPLSVGQDILGAFDLKGVSFFLRAKISKLDQDEVHLVVAGDFYKSERRQNFRLLAYPIYDITASFKLPARYEGGKVVDIRNKSSQTGLFKSFLRIVEPLRSPDEQELLRIRVQDLSLTGMSVFIGAAELDWFRAGDLLPAVEVNLQGDELTFAGCRVVYVVDQIGRGDRQQKNYKVGIRFEAMPGDLERRLAEKINGLLRSIDANKEFEDFIK
jgi:hypothetical protein